MKAKIIILDHDLAYAAQPQAIRSRTSAGAAIMPRRAKTHLPPAADKIGRVQVIRQVWLRLALLDRVRPDSQST